MALLRPRDQSHGAGAAGKEKRNQAVPPGRGCGVEGFWEMLALEAAAVLGLQGGAAACPACLTQHKESLELWLLPPAGPAWCCPSSEAWTERHGWV